MSAVVSKDRLQMTNTGVVTHNRELGEFITLILVVNHELFATVRIRPNPREYMVKCVDTGDNYYWYPGKMPKTKYDCFEAIIDSVNKLFRRTAHDYLTEDEKQKIMRKIVMLHNKVVEVNNEGQE